MILGIFAFAAFAIAFKTYAYYGFFTNIFFFFYFVICFAIIGKAIGLLKSYIVFIQENQTKK